MFIQQTQKNRLMLIIANKRAYINTNGVITLIIEVIASNYDIIKHKAILQ